MGQPPSFRATYSRYGEGRRSEEAAVLEEHREGIEQGREEGYPILPSGGCEDKAEEPPQLPPDEAPWVHHPRDGPNPPRGSLQGKEGRFPQAARLGTPPCHRSVQGERCPPPPRPPVVRHRHEHQGRHLKGLRPR